MIKSTITGYPRIGEKRELKHALEKFWSKSSDFEELENTAKSLRQKHWTYQKESGLDLISINDFSYYDNILDTSILLGAIPKRFQDESNEQHQQYFSMARGNKNSVAMEMTKWFNTNYHYIVPELSHSDEYKLNATKILNEYKEAKELGITPKINIIGPITYLGLAKRVDGGDTFELFNKILFIYKELLEEISKLDTCVYVQIDEPILSTDENQKVLSLIKPTYDKFCAISKNLKIIVTTYFEHSNEATKILVNTPIYALGLDFISNEENLNSLEFISKSEKKLFAGIVDGRNIWKNNFEATLLLLEKISSKVKKENIVISSSCSLLHVPYSLRHENKMDKEVKSWLSYANEKILEINTLSNLFFDENLTHNEIVLIQEQLQVNKEANQKRKNSNKIHDKNVQNRVLENKKFQRDEPFKERIKIQKEILKYPDLATTTIGSFPQTPEIRKNKK